MEVLLLIIIILFATTGIYSNPSKRRDNIVRQQKVDEIIDSMYEDHRNN